MATQPSLREVAYTYFVNANSGGGGGTGGGGSMIYLLDADPVDQGNAGDIAINTTDGSLWGNVAGTWTEAGNLTGPEGPQGPEGPEGPQGPAGEDATITPAAFVDGETGTVADVCTALINAGLMASS